VEKVRVGLEKDLKMISKGACLLGT
jgi:hypothetical protein